MENDPIYPDQMQQCSAEGAIMVGLSHECDVGKQWTAHVREEEFLQQFHFNIC